MKLHKNSTVGYRYYAGMLNWGPRYMDWQKGEIATGWRDGRFTPDRLFWQYILQQ